jgi:hypothetical protein
VADPARLQASHQLQPEVEYRMFLVHDVMADPLAGNVPDGEWIVHAGPGGVVLGSGGNDFFPAVTLELWSGTPAADPGPWDAVDEADFEVGSGLLRVRAVLGRPAGPDLSVGVGRFRLRAHCRGRAQARARIGAELYYHGIEHWLLQVWRVGELPERRPVEDPADRYSPEALRARQFEQWRAGQG